MNLLSHNRINYPSYFFYILITSVLFLVSCFFFTFKMYGLSSIFVLIINLIYLIKFRNRIPIFLIFIYILFHTKIFIDFFLFKKQISFWTDFQYDKYMAPVLLSHLLFLFTLGTFLDFKKKIINNFNHLITEDKNLYIIILLSSFYFLFFGLSGDNIFTSGTYNTGNVNKSSLHEYFILFYIVSFFFIPNKLTYKIIQFSLLLFYIFKTFLYGARIEAIEIILVFINFYYILLNKINTKYIYFLILFGIYLMLLISNIRDNPSKLFSDNYSELFNISNLLDFNSINENNSTEGDVVQSSARMVGLIDNGNLNIFQRIYSFFIYLLSPILPNFILPDYSNLSTFLQSKYSSGGGGLISTYFYCWLGYFGPIIIAFILSYFINRFYQFKSKSFFVYGLVIISTFPRWFSYNPIFIVKFCLYTLIIYLFFLNLKMSKL